MFDNAGHPIDCWILIFLIIVWSRHWSNFAFYRPLGGGGSCKLSRWYWELYWGEGAIYLGVKKCSIGICWYYRCTYRCTSWTGIVQNCTSIRYWGPGMWSRSRSFVNSSSICSSGTLHVITPPIMILWWTNSLDLSIFITHPVLTQNGSQNWSAEFAVLPTLSILALKSWFRHKAKLSIMTHTIPTHIFQAQTPGMRLELSEPLRSRYDASISDVKLLSRLSHVP